MDNRLSVKVQMQFMRPRQLEDALRRFPVIYVPFGLIEWHGRHLPLGNDALKAHAILVKCAEQFGGVVYPPVYFPYTRYVEGSEALHPGEDNWKIAMLTALFNRIKAMGTRVIIGVSGHNVPQQITWINRALEPVIADGTITGIGLWEMTLSRCEESSSDHAAKWETSNMMFFYPELVDMAELGAGPLAPAMKPPDGIGGLDPRLHASVEVGRRNVELAVAAIGKKAKELLAMLPEDQRAFNLPAICPPHWWSI
ncbi:MAG: creatininase family protein [Kiritimatiellae bacterium]|nr:creatininase family protein [Kiritimatiellia bacterium]